MQRRIEEHHVLLKERNNYFILIPSNKVIPSIEQDEFISTGISDSTHFEKLNELVNNSTETIKLATFLFDDLETADLLIKTSNRLKGGVYVLTSVLDRHLRDAFGYTKDQENNHLKVLRKLENSPVAVKCVPGLHSKFWVFDNSIGVITSSNLTNNSLYNVPELGILVQNLSEVNYLNYLFNRLWVEFTTRIMVGGKLCSVSGVAKSPRIHIDIPPNIHPYLKINDVHSNLSITKWYEKYHELIDQATSSIKISTWSISLKNTKLLELLCIKLKKNVKVELLIAKHHFKRNSEIRNLLFTMKSKHDNFNYYIHPSNHSKFIIVDNKKCFLTTKNYDASDSYLQSIELGIEFVNKLKLIDIWNKLVGECYNLEFKATRREYLHSIISYEDINIYEKNISIWIWHPQKPVFYWLEGPNLSYICSKIEKSISIYLYKLQDEKKVIQIFPDFNLILSKDNRLIRLENNILNNLEIASKWILGSDKIIFQRYEQY